MDIIEILVTLRDKYKYMGHCKVICHFIIIIIRLYSAMNKSKPVLVVVFWQMVDTRATFFLFRKVQKDTYTYVEC